MATTVPVSLIFDPSMETDDLEIGNMTIRSNFTIVHIHARKAPLCTSQTHHNTAEDENVSTLIRGIRFPRRDQSPTRAILTDRKFQLNQNFILTDFLKLFCAIKVKEDYILSSCVAGILNLSKNFASIKFQYFSL